MINFRNIDYLKAGNTKQKLAYNVLTKNKILDILRSYSPILTGTIPINIDIEDSDLDIACHWNNKDEFIDCITKKFNQFDTFNIKETIKNGFETIIASFQLENFTVEIFGQNKPSDQQESYRHMLVEHKILQSNGETFRKQIVVLKQKGLKTEPAFCKLLGIEGNPYVELLKL